VLGSGAGGVTRRVRWNGADVAVKNYRGAAVTSDGLPETERMVSVAVAGYLSNDNNNSNNKDAFVRVLGVTAGTQSLVMEYLHGYGALAGPPSMESCTRDVYCRPGIDACHALSWTETAHLLTAILDALAVLHAKLGIVHGDLYGHNILICAGDPMQVRLSDFGAAYFYDRSAAYGALLERIELRAYAVLVEEVGAKLLNERSDARTGMLDRLLDECGKESATFESVQIGWKQALLADLGSQFGMDGEE
jgi:serine/threonine protein kinase